MTPAEQAFKIDNKVMPVSAQSLRGNSEEKISSLLNQIQSLPENDSAPFEQPALIKKPGNVLRLFIATDVAALAVGFVVAWLSAVAINDYVLDRADLNEYFVNNLTLVLQFAGLSFGVIMRFMFANHYQTRVPFWMETRKIVETIGLAMLANCFLQVVAKEDFSRIWLLSGWIFSAACIIGFRALARKALRMQNAWTIPALIIGDGKTAEEARKVLGSDSNLGYEIVTQIKDLTTAHKQAGFSWAKLCKLNKAAHVIVAVEGKDMAHVQQALGQLMREQVEFSVVPPTHNFPVVGITPQFFLGQDVLLMIRKNGLDQPLPRLFKRAFDIVLSLGGLVVAGPVMLVLAILVKRDGGKAFYGHKRIGYNGKAFYCLKMRSMVMNGNEVLQQYLAYNPEAQAEWARDHKLRNDPRVTKIGDFMRRTSLDELPQLINVLRGEMSIVGPRPIVVAETTKYDNDIAYYYRVRPGVTGLWQVSGRSDVTYNERVRMDSWYVRNWSFWNDIAIICKTFGVVLKGRGAC